MIKTNRSINGIREKMFHEMAEKKIFSQVKDYAFD